MNKYGQTTNKAFTKPNLKTVIGKFQFFQVNDKFLILAQRSGSGSRVITDAILSLPWVIITFDVTQNRPLLSREELLSIPQLTLDVIHRNKPGSKMNQLKKHFGYHLQLYFNEDIKTRITFSDYENFFITGLQDSIQMDEIEKSGYKLILTPMNARENVIPIKSSKDFLSNVVILTLDGNIPFDFSIYFNGEQDKMTNIPLSSLQL